MFGGAAGFELSNQFIFRDVFDSQQRIKLRGRLLQRRPLGDRASPPRGNEVADRIAVPCNGDRRIALPANTLRVSLETSGCRPSQVPWMPRLCTHLYAL
jgi:hypothetical protein